MEPQRNSGTITFDRRRIYRPFLERLNPLASPRSLIEEDLIVSRDHDPKDFEQPSIHVAFARAAELTRGVQMALVGGIGSGKTVELLLTERVLRRHTDSVNLFLDLADVTDLSRLNTASILIAIGMNLFECIPAVERTDAINAANRRLRELAFGKTEYIPKDDFPDDSSEDPADYEEADDYVPITIPGLLKPRFPALRRQVKEVRELLGTIIAPLLDREVQITVLLDGLDRLIQPELFASSRNKISAR